MLRNYNLATYSAQAKQLNFHKNCNRNQIAGVRVGTVITHWPGGDIFLPFKRRPLAQPGAVTPCRHVQLFSCCPCSCLLCAVCVCSVDKVTSPASNVSVYVLPLVLLPSHKCREVFQNGGARFFKKGPTKTI
jgi:hypothetical protein